LNVVSGCAPWYGGGEVRNKPIRNEKPSIRRGSRDVRLLMAMPPWVPVAMPPWVLMAMPPWVLMAMPPWAARASA
jgi:hypothetical protein